MKPTVTVAVFGIVAVIFLVHGTDAIVWNAILMKTKIYNETKKSHYIRIPESCYESEMDFYEIITPEKSFTYAADIRCPKNDPTVCLITDKMCNIAGIQLSMKEEDLRHVDKRYYNISSVVGYTKLKIFNQTVYAVRVYLTNPCILTESGRRDTSEVAEGIFIKIGEEWVTIDRCQPNGPRMGDFYMQGCYPKLGQIYVYKFNRYSECKNGFFFYVSYYKGSLVEFGLLSPGRGSRGPKRDWYARPSGKPFRDLLPSPPPCFFPLERFGFTSLQVFLIDNPDSIKCIQCKA